jgi:hypothetical protein
MQGIVHCLNLVGCIAAAAAAAASLQRRDGEWYPAGLPGLALERLVHCLNLVGCSAAAAAVLQRREGDWYPAGLPGSDMQGMLGYKIWLSVGLLLGEGAYIMAKAALLGKLKVNALAACSTIVFVGGGRCEGGKQQQHLLIASYQLGRYLVPRR